MTPVAEALQRVLDAVTPLGTERVPLAQAPGRVLAAAARSVHALPLFTQSAVDGYAVRHADICAAPCELPLVQHIAAAAQAQPPLLAPGTAARILTGAMLPLGADTVLRQERCERAATHVRALETVPLGTDIRHEGEEIAAGAEVAAVGARLTPGLIGALAMAGVAEVCVYRRPRITVLVGGDEVCAVDAPRALGQIPDANGPMVAAWLQGEGTPPQRLLHLPDDPDLVQRALAAAFADSDVVITTGGVSVGDHDYIPASAEAAGATRLLWKLAQKPGMPLYVARHGTCLLFGLPGNPASVLTNLLVYVGNALSALQGLDPLQRWRRGQLAAPVKRDTSKTLWLRMAVEYNALGAPRLLALRGQASHMLGNLAQAQALVEVPPVEGDDRVRWLPL